MKPFSVILTHSQANLIFNALNNHIQIVQKNASELIQYLDSEFKKANIPAEEPKVDEATEFEEHSTNG